MKLYIAIITLFTSLFSFGQQHEIPYINAQHIRGIYNTGTEGLSLLFLENRNYDKKDIYQISFLNENNEKLAFEMDEKSVLMEVATNNGRTFFVFKNPVLDNIEIVKISKSHEVSRAFAPEPAENVVFSGYSTMETNQAENLFIFRAYSVWELNEKKERVTIEYGTEILSYASDLQLIGSYRMKYDPKTRPTITGFTPIKEGFVLSVETKDYKEKQYDLNLQIFTNELALRGTYVLTNDGTYFPTEIISDNNQIIIAGYNLKGSIFDSKDVEGLFVTSLNMDGSVKKANKFSWVLLKEKLKDNGRGDFIFSGKMGVLVEQIIPSENGYKIICESYANNSGKTIAEIALGGADDNRMVVVYDFVIFNTDAAGTLGEVIVLEKEPMNIQIGAGRMSKSSRIEFAYYLKKYQAFPFRSVKDNVITFVNYKNQIGYLSTMDMLSGTVIQGDPISIIPVVVEETNEASEEFIANSSALSKLDGLSNKLDNTSGKLDKLGNKLEYGIEKVDLDFDPWGNRDNGMFSFQNGSHLGFVVHPNRHSIFIAPVK
ncbi:hypothetical protein DNU06_03210 [Putridiphycobacter roseus]|uniref:Uncharacterized protein n=1 Tax=Putridiphycobacter roseus TaxID=2219161 RepID=A0A2W1NT74_9FLAO|nr:hypothetical protein [Putridiphycobacter roseus]PZE18852.1 hypothetical protein DNU06_03210 [Putridiphycobacter roseus]